MTFENIFSPFIYKVNLDDNEFLKRKIVPQINKKRRKSRSLVPSGWFCDVFSSYRYTNKNRTVYDGSKYLNGEESKEFYNDFDNTCLMRTYINQVSIFLDEIGLNNNKDIESTCAFNIDMWYNAYKKDQYQEWHNHSGVTSDFSAIHYLKYDEDVHSPTIFKNPTSKSQIFSSITNSQKLRGTKNSLYSEVYHPNIREGDLIIFPSWLEHMCPPNKSNELRIAVAFNIELL